MSFINKFNVFWGSFFYIFNRRCDKMGVLIENEVKRKIGKNKNNIIEFYIEKG